MNNLLSNAIKFTPEGGRVRIRARRVDDETFEFEVEDTGIGIPLDEQATIFEKFRQGHTLPGQTAVTREYGGTGLGLSIVKELSKLLGGEVSLVSEFGKGSTFSVRLPIRLDERSSAHGESASANVGLNRATHKLLGSEPLSSEPAADRRFSRNFGGRQNAVGRNGRVAWPHGFGLTRSKKSCTAFRYSSRAT